MEFCDMQCKHATWPKDDAVDGSGSCRTFQALYCKKKENSSCTRTFPALKKCGVRTIRKHESCNGQNRLTHV